MQKQSEHRCNRCGKKLGEIACSNKYGGSYCSGRCADEAEFEMKLAGGKVWETIEPINPILNEPNHSIFNEPDHYHKYEIDTIGFLQKGFHPRVFTGFAIGSAVKYLHRYENKNGLEDLLKAQDFVNRLIDWHKKNPL